MNALLAETKNSAAEREHEMVIELSRPEMRSFYDRTNAEENNET